MEDKRVIIVNVMGGLGNQMFQYACGQAIAEITNMKVRYLIDSFFTFENIRSLELDRVFGITLPLANDGDLSNIVGHWRKNPKIRRILSHSIAGLLRGKYFLVEKRFSFISNLVERCSHGAYLHGYWQSEKYFDSCADVIRNGFNFQGNIGSKNLELLARINIGASIGVHVRRGDYISSKAAKEKHGVLPAVYFIKAVEELRTIMPDARVFVFSDDPVWVKQYLLGAIDNAECISHNSSENSFRDMQLMAQCDALVIANSSFSWWAAWLNNKPNKIVVAPKKWFADDKLDDSSIVPSSWLRR